MSDILQCHDCEELIESQELSIKDNAGVILASFCQECWELREKDGYDYSESKNLSEKIQNAVIFIKNSIDINA